MAKNEMDAMVSRISELVAKEVGKGEKAFSLSELPDQVKKLENTVDNAWEISYNTSSDIVTKPGNIGKPSLAEAWSISYSTASAVSVRSRTAKK